MYIKDTSLLKMIPDVGPSKKSQKINYNDNHEIDWFWVKIRHNRRCFWIDVIHPISQTSNKANRPYSVCLPSMLEVKCRWFPDKKFEEYLWIEGAFCCLTFFVWICY